jgi:hypothetical protein
MPEVIVDIYAAISVKNHSNEQIYAKFYRNESWDGPSNTGHKMSATRGAAEHHGTHINCSTRMPHNSLGE